jgi:hypothetical protein
MGHSILFIWYLLSNEYTFKLFIWLVNLTNNNLTIGQNGNKNKQYIDSIGR